MSEMEKAREDYFRRGGDPGFPTPAFEAGWLAHDKAVREGMHADDDDLLDGSYVRDLLDRLTPPGDRHER